MQRSLAQAVAASTAAGEGAPSLQTPPSLSSAFLAVIINAPTVFKMVWAIVKPMLDPRTQAKIEVGGWVGGGVVVMGPGEVAKFGLHCRPAGCAVSCHVPAPPWWLRMLNASTPFFPYRPLVTCPPRRLQVAPSDFMRVLQKWVDIDCIPEYLGGWQAGEGGGGYGAWVEGVRDGG